VVGSVPSVSSRDLCVASVPKLLICLDRSCSVRGDGCSLLLVDALLVIVLVIFLEMVSLLMCFVS